MEIIDKNIPDTKKENLLVLIQILGGIIIPKINNKSIAEVSRKYQTDFIPARWIFSIWPILYCCLFYGFYKQEYEWDRTSETLFECVTFSNISWIYFWTKENIVLSGLSFIPLCISLYKLFIRNLNNTDLFLQNTLAAYLCWTLIASTLNCASVLKYKIKNKKYKKIIGILLCFTQIFWTVKGNTIDSFNDKKNFYTNSNTYPLVGMIAYLALKKNSINVNNQLKVYLLCCIINCLNQINRS